mmetsp:Transcript_48515/g.154956  ORF Transcript_48515/g.154956 Transcript_48515/m.154956 type:complete len:178 (+) Transcript_48515:130-663(+)
MAVCTASSAIKVAADALGARTIGGLAWEGPLAFVGTLVVLHSGAGLWRAVRAAWRQILLEAACPHCLELRLALQRARARCPAAGPRATSRGARRGSSTKHKAALQREVHKLVAKCIRLEQRVAELEASKASQPASPFKFAPGTPPARRERGNGRASSVGSSPGLDSECRRSSCTSNT